MQRILFTILSLILANSIFCQTKIRQSIHNLNAQFEKSKSKPRIFLLGVFHFTGEKVDSNTTEFQWRYKPDEPRRQKEIEAVRKRLQKMQPSVICVEVNPSRQHQLDSVYASYCKGEDISTSGFSGETVLLGFETAKRLGLKQIFAVDAPPMTALMDQKIYTEYEKYAPAEGRDTLYNEWAKAYNENQRFSDSLRHQYSTLDYLRFINHKDYNKKKLGRWLITTRFGTNSHPVGADQFITRYYNRNIRIYSNIQRVITKPDDRVLVIFGNTHMSILKNLFESSPLYTVTPVDRYLK